MDAGSRMFIGATPVKLAGVPGVVVAHVRSTGRHNNSRENIVERWQKAGRGDGR